MKKIITIIIVIFLVILGIFFTFKTRTILVTNIPTTLNLEYLIDQDSSKKDDYLYYVADVDHFNSTIENKYNLNNLKLISEFYSTGFKNISRLSKKDILSNMKMNIVAVYYIDESWLLPISDSCVAIIEDNKSQRYLINIYDISLCKE